MLRILENY